MAAFGLGVFYGGVIVGVPVVTGVAEGVRHQKEQNREAANQDRMIKFYIDVDADTSSARVKAELAGSILVLAGDKAWLTPQDERTQLPERVRDAQGSGELWDPHPFTGFYLMYPDDDRNPRERGLVSTISVDPPMLNWLYVDHETHEVRYGNRSGSIEHMVGPWDWTDDEAGVMLDDFEGFVAVEEPPEKRFRGLKWALYFDRDDDGLKGVSSAQGLKGKRRVVECLLGRRCLPEELRKAQDAAAEEKMQVKSTGDLKTKWG